MRTNPNDALGKTYGEYTVIYVPPRRIRNLVLARCSCGTERMVSAYTLQKGTSRSCGCKSPTKGKSLHGLSAHPDFRTTYSAWMAMNARCNNPNAKRFKTYGGRGIKVCSEWKNFERFVRDMGKRPEGYTIERKNVDGNYCKENCEWIPASEQHGNNTRTVWVEFSGRKMAVTHACKAAGVSPHSFFQHRRSHPEFSVQEIFELTVESYKPRGPYKTK